MKKDLYKKGFTLPELLISIFIISILTLTVSVFQRDVFSLNFMLQGSLNAQIDARHVVKVMINELRRAEPSALGAYPIAAASSTAITFYSDVNGDGTTERVRYFVSGNSVRRGIVVPTGNPLAYNDASETLTTIVSGFVSSSTLPLFQYYPSTYTGTTTPLTSPVNIPSVRLVKVTVIIDKDLNKSPTKIIVTSQVNLRNLKDNL